MKSPKLSLHPAKPVRAGLLRIAGALVRSAVARTARSAADRGDDIHALRTTIKRLRSLLRLVRPVIDEADFLRADARWRAASRRLSAVRESHVAGRTLAALAESARRPRDRVALAAALAGFPPDARPPGETERALRQVAGELQKVGRELRGLRFADEGWDAIEPGLRATYAAGRRRMRAAIADGKTAAFHRWRIRAKNLFYQLAVLGRGGSKPLRKMIARLDKLQKKIGDDHDLAVVKAALQEKPDAFGGAESVERVVRLLDQRSEKLRRASAPLGRTIYRRKPRRFTRELHRAWTASPEQR